MMTVRPTTPWIPIHPNYIAGLAAITAPFILYSALALKNKTSLQVILFNTIGLLGLSFVFFTIVMTTSRGVIMAIVSGLGVLLLWKFMNLNGIKQRFRSDAYFPFFVILYLFGIVAFLYLGPANSGSIFSGNYFYGNGSRGELFSRSLYLLEDYLITGGGLGSFPGLYSQYLLNIPFFNVPNSHNLFLDVAIELGLLGGLSFLLMYLASIWFVSRSLINQNTDQEQLLNFILLFSLIVAVVHGMVDDYLFNGNGTILSLFLVALSILVAQRNDLPKTVGFRLSRRIAGLMLFSLAILLVVFSKNILSVWNANLGSVQMSQVELNGFPKNGWAGPAILSELDNAEIALRTSLQFDSNNRTANQRLGMISMLGQNFELASKYLNTAYEVAPDHRGVVKSLGYCYVWLGDLEKAELLLSKIPEAQEELDVYVWWWDTQGRDDLSNKAALVLGLLKSTSNQP
jgi:tetratricopeptide (TPR) repeat protein